MTTLSNDGLYLSFPEATLQI